MQSFLFYPSHQPSHLQKLHCRIFSQHTCFVNEQEFRIYTTRSFTFPQSSASALQRLVLCPVVCCRISRGAWEQEWERLIKKSLLLELRARSRSKPFERLILLASLCNTLIRFYHKPSPVLFLLELVGFMWSQITLIVAFPCSKSTMSLTSLFWKLMRPQTVSVAFVNISLSRCFMFISVQGYVLLMLFLKAVNSV